MFRLTTLLLYISTLTFYSQNFLKNGDFEDFDSCPTLENMPPNDSSHLKYWHSINSVDYFNKCGDSNYGVPNNIFGKSEAQNGSGYIGIALTTVYNGYYEQLYIKLNAPLEKDSVYKLTMYIQITEYSLNLNNFEVYFASNKPINFKNYYTSNINNYSPVSIPELKFKKTKEWKKIEADYVAKGNEKYFLIGMINHLNLNNSNFNEVLCSSNKTVDKLTRVVIEELPTLYYYVDNIIIIKK